MSGAPATVPRSYAGRDDARSARGDDRSSEPVSDLAPIAGGSLIRNTLERSAALQARTAAILRATGMRSEAARADQLAARTRLILDESKATRRMKSFARGLCESSHTTELLERALEGAMSLMGGDFGNVQIRHPTDGTLRIAVQTGFEVEFLEYFAVVGDDASACGRAATQRSQTVIVDVDNDAAFAPHREIAAAARFRAVQSTPLLDPTGRLHGVISTHFRQPHRPSTRDLHLTAWFAEYIATALAQRQNHRTTLFEVNAALHANTAALHDNAAGRINDSALAVLANGNATKADAIKDWAQRAVERARRERERAQALTARETNQCPSRAPLKRHPPS